LSTTKTQVNIWSALHELVNVFDVTFVKQFQIIMKQLSKFHLWHGRSAMEANEANASLLKRQV
jgi:hypothetical protein